MRNILTTVLISGTSLLGSVALAQAGSTMPAQPRPAGDETKASAQQVEPSSACLAQQKGLEAELAAIDKMTSGEAKEEAPKPKKKSKVAKVAKAVVGAAATVLLPPAVGTIAAAGAAAAKGNGKPEKADTDATAKPSAEQAEAAPTAPAAEVPALLERRQELEQRLAEVKQGSCTP